MKTKSLTRMVVLLKCTLLTTLAVALLACGQISTVAQTVTKEVMLGKIVSAVIVPGYQELEAKCVMLTNALEAFVNAPTAESLETARRAWLAAMLASRQIQWLQAGPIADREYLATFYYWKVFPGRIDGVMSSSRAIDDSYLGEVSATTKGMFALEY